IKKINKWYYFMFIVCLCIFICVKNNYSLYNKAIAHITNVKTEYLSEKNGEKTYKQTLKAVIKNGKHKGKNIELTNIYSESLVYTDIYHKGNDVFIKDRLLEDGTTGYSIIGLKRDIYIVFLSLLMFCLLIVFCNKQGVLSILSLIFNICIFLIVLKLYASGIDLLPVCLLAIIVFSIVTLILINGFNRKTLCCIASVIICIAIISVFSVISILKNNKIDYEFMDFLFFGYEQIDANIIFICEILLCGLGAIMDISITITSSVNEIITNNPNLSSKEIYKSCKNIGNDILGTMINVMFFSNLAGCLPLMILSMRNDISMFSLLRYNCYFEITRCLTGSIGIIIAIPVSTIVAIKLLRKQV
nr:YibE/F family protein [Lachnospiraceae bacterium]